MSEWNPPSTEPKVDPRPAILLAGVREIDEQVARLVRSYAVAKENQDIAEFRDLMLAIRPVLQTARRALVAAAVVLKDESVHEMIDNAIAHIDAMV
jgi:hypothetical protein